jgi:hypothetical protein
MADARAWIGESAADDKLDLAKIKAAVAAEAVDLHQMLGSAKISGQFGIRRTASEEAAAAQIRFQRLSAVAAVSAAVAALTSGLLLYGAGAGTDATATPPVDQVVSWVKDHRIWIIGVQVIGLFCSAVVTSVLVTQNYVERWQQQRQRAETLRRQIFTDILSMAEAKVPNAIAAPDPTNPIAQAFEFFRRYQAELQRNYYTKAAAKHESAGSKWGWVTAILGGLAAIAGLLGSLGTTALVVSAFLGIGVPIVLSAVQSWRTSARDSDKRAEYQRAKEALDNNLLTIDEVRERAAIGDAAAVGAYVNSVHLIMTTEHEAWTPAARPG